MKDIDLSILHSNTVDSINIDDDFLIPEEYYKDSDVRGFKKIHAKGYIKRETDDSDIVNLDVNGVMILQDSISLNDVDYPFSFKIEGNLEEFLGNLPNTLDIFEFLWENIVLEVPLKYTEEEDLSKFHGDGWSLRSEDDIVVKDNPFTEILKKF